MAGVKSTNVQFRSGPYRSSSFSARYIDQRPETTTPTTRGKRSAERACHVDDDTLLLLVADKNGQVKERERKFYPTLGRKEPVRKLTMTPDLPSTTRLPNHGSMTNAKAKSARWAGRDTEKKQKI